jgi:branched-chain amino acid transport system permease protein
VSDTVISLPVRVLDPAPAPPPERIVSSRNLRLIGLGLLFIALVAFPYVVTSTRWLDAANQTLIAAIGAIALSVLIGVAGQFSMGSAAFMAIGAFTASAVSTQLWELPFLVALVAGTLVGGVAAVILGLLALRIRGFYLALATIALHYIVIFGAQRFQDNTVGIVGFLMPAPDVFGYQILSPRGWYPVLAVTLILVAWAVHNLLRGRTGRSFQAVKDRDIAAAILGVNVTRTKLTAFIITSMLIGFQGALYAYYLGVVTYETFTLEVSVQYIAMIMIGGVATVSGSILGAVFVVILPYLVQELVPRLPDWVPFSDTIATNLFAVQSIIYGVAIIVFILRMPNGLAYGVKRLGLRLDRTFNRRRPTSATTPRVGS